MLNIFSMGVKDFIIKLIIMDIDIISLIHIMIHTKITQGIQECMMKNIVARVYMMIVMVVDLEVHVCMKIALEIIMEDIEHTQTIILIQEFGGTTIIKIDIAIMVRQEYHIIIEILDCKYIMLDNIIKVDIFEIKSIIRALEAILGEVEGTIHLILLPAMDILHNSTHIKKEEFNKS